MIILIGPDGSGKTTLAKKLGLPYYHYAKDSKYEDYLKPLAGLQLVDAVLDRHMLCEYSYSIVMKRPFAYSIKQWHNIIMLTLAQNPLTILCTHKPIASQYPASQYLPFERWDQCLGLYRELLTTNYIKYIEYDYIHEKPIDYFLALDSAYRKKIDWWIPMWKSGWGFIGSTYPKFLLVGERQGPNNLNSIPFECGPTGWMLSNMVQAVKMPLGALAVTNMVKSFRKDTRKPNDKDIELLREEIVNLKPKKVIFMGTPARQGIPLAKELGCEVDTIVHLGALNHKGVKDLSGYHNEFKKIIGMTPKLEYR